MRLALLAREFDLEVEPDLASMLPPVPTDQDTDGVEELQRWLAP